MAVSVGLAQLPLVVVEDDSGDGAPAFEAVEPDAGLATELFAVDPGEQVERLGDPAELGDRATKAAAASAALQDAQQLGGADGAGGQRPGDAQDVLPLLADQLGSMRWRARRSSGPYWAYAIDAPEALVGHAGGAGAELVAQKPEQPEDLIGE